jgi:hypothetical protein
MGNTILPGGDTVVYFMGKNFLRIIFYLNIVSRSVFAICQTVQYLLTVLFPVLLGIFILHLFPPLFFRPEVVSTAGNGKKSDNQSKPDNPGG